MIVKILASAPNFEGIDYNERKNDEGKSELLQAENFNAIKHGSEELEKSDLINYMNLVSALNPQVKNKQFHAVISTKGREHSPDELRQIGVHFLEKMGYGQNPYLIYAHSDTKNNHVHLVSTRINKEGKKVDDSFEKLKSQKVMQEVLDLNPAYEAVQAYVKATEFNFSTQAQFMLLVERQGFKVEDNGRLYDFIKYGGVQNSFIKSEVEEKVKAYTSQDDRIKQLQAIFKKYKPGLHTDEFVKLTKDKFGLEIIFHQAGNHVKPYGYTVIDNAKKEVYKGSQIMPLAEVLNNTTRAERIGKAKDIIGAIVESDTGFSKFRKDLSEVGFKIKADGTITIKGEYKPVLELDKDLLKQLKYNDRVTEALKYNISSDQDKEVLAKLFFIKPENLKVGEADEKARETYKNLLHGIHDYRDLGEGLAEHKLKVIKDGNDYFLIDRKNHQFHNVKDLTDRKIDFEGKTMVMDLQRTRSQSQSIDQQLTVADGGNPLQTIFGIIGSMDMQGDKESSNRKRRKLH